MDWTTILRSQQLDLIGRLQSQSAILHQLTNPKLRGYHRELTVVSGEILAQICQPGEAIADLRQRLGGWVIQNYLDNTVTPMNLENKSAGDRSTYFQLTSEPKIKILVKTECGNLETIRWKLDSRNLEQFDILVCMFIPEITGELPAEDRLIFAGFLPISMIKLEKGETLLKLEDILYGGGLKAYVQSFLWNCLHTLIGHTDAVLCVAIAPDGQTVVSGSRDTTIKIWNLEAGTLIHTYQGHIDAVNTVNFSDSGNLMASGSSDKTISIWDLQTGELIRTLYGHSDRVEYLVFSPDGQTLASSSADNIILIWNLVTGELIRRLEGNQNSDRPVAITPDGQAITSSSMEKTIKIWDMKTGELISNIDGHADAVESVVFSSDGKTLVSGSIDKTVKVWRRGCI